MSDDLFNEKIADASKTIFSYCMAKTPNREEAEDLCQDILCELVKSQKNLRDPDAFYGFMWAVAGNVYKQWCRKRAGAKEVKLSDNIPAEDPFPDGEDDSGIYLLRRELSLLSEKYRRATILYYIDGKSCAEISQILSISESMVKYLLFKSRKILKEGMNMERKLGTHSYNPKDLIPLYMGSGPNQFWSFMQSKIRQNIVSACYNDSLTPEQISLETGIPLPYLDDEIRELTDKKILLKDGTHYKANVIVISSECSEEIARSVSDYHKQIADKIAELLDENLENFKKIGFAGNDFSENTLRWQLLAFLILQISKQDGEYDPPKTAWGDYAYMWLAEKGSTLDKHIFNFSQPNDRQGNRIHFLDYLPKQKGDHHDFYGNERYVGILCDIARGNGQKFSEYDLEAVAEMIRKGYVRKEENGYRVTMPVFTTEQDTAAVEMVQDFMNGQLGEIIREMGRVSAKILGEHTPKHLQDQVAGIAGMDKFVSTACIPISILVDRKVLSTDWHPLEMPTTFVVLNG